MGKIDIHTSIWQQTSSVKDTSIGDVPITSDNLVRPNILAIFLKCVSSKENKVDKTGEPQATLVDHIALCTEDIQVLQMLAHKAVELVEGLWHDMGDTLLQE